MSPIPGYQNPNVYVQQAPSPIITNAVLSTVPNILFLAYTPNAPTNNQVDTFQFTSYSGIQTFTLSQSGTISNFSLTNSLTGSVLVSGTNYSGPTTVSGVTTFTTISGSSFVANSTYLQCAYTYTTVSPGNVYAFTDYNSAVNLFGQPFTYTGSAPAINSPASLAAFLAFQNGAPQVSLMNIVSASGSTADFLATIQSFAGVDSFDLVVPLVYDTAYNSGASGPLFNGISQFLTAQANNGIFQRSFIGLDSSVTGSAPVMNVPINIANSIGNSRVSVINVPTINYNPGFNSANGLTTGVIAINGYYAAAAAAGLWASQAPQVPLTHKTLAGFANISSQLTSSQETTLQSYGVLVLAQQRDGIIYIRHGLTTNTSNWLTQEISISTVGDYVANNFKQNFINTNLIGQPLTSSVMAAVNNLTVHLLNDLKTTGVIQGYTGINIVQNVNNPTQVLVSFQYSPTLPLNYISVTIAINTSNGAFTVTAA
jgi:hypothetical protein